MSKLFLVLATAVCLIASGGLLWAATDSAAIDQSKRQAAWLAYLSELQASLTRIGTARDLVLAAELSTLLDYSEAMAGGAAEFNPEHPQAQELYRSAATKAEDDTLVHWLLATNSTRDDVQRQSVEALQRLDPNNGMVWVLALDIASRSKDDEGVASAMGHLTESVFFTTYLRDLVLLGLGAIDRFPQILAADFAADKVAEVRFGTAIALASAFNIPDFQPLVDECRAERTSVQPKRSDECIAAGRKMFSGSKEYLPMAVGNSVLRIQHAPESTENAKQIAWYRAASTLAFDTLLGNSDAMEMLEEAWRHSPDEIVAYKQLMTRAGLPLIPPDDWEPGNPVVPADKSRPED